MQIFFAFILYNNSLMLNWIGDGNLLFFWLFLKEYNNKLYKEIEKKVAINQKGDFMIERTKYSDYFDVVYRFVLFIIGKTDFCL